MLQFEGTIAGTPNASFNYLVEAFSDVDFNEEFGASPAVPEPATWAMMLAGFGAIGTTLRMRRRSEKRAIA